MVANSVHPGLVTSEFHRNIPGLLAPLHKFVFGVFARDEVQVRACNGCVYVMDGCVRACLPARALSRSCVHWSSGARNHERPTD